jgi:RNA polymerase sigma-70 factor, ECF subfamily
MALFQDMLVDHLPQLHAYAWRLSRNRAMADDLVQETAFRALCNIDRFMPGTNMKAWLSTILRNQFYNEMRSRSSMAGYVAIPRPAGHAAEQEARIELRDFERALRALPAVQSEALSLVGASGFSYEEAAEIVGCPTGTIKSRVCRARSTIEQRSQDNAPVANVARSYPSFDFKIAA